MHPDVQEILLTEEQIASRVAELGVQISQDYAGEEVILVSVLNGAMPFTCDLMRKLDGDIVLDSIVASSYGSGTVSSGEVKIKKDMKQDVAGRHVLLVDDVFDTGLTMSLLVNLIKERNAKSVKSCVFLNKPARRTVDYHPDYIGYDIPDAFVIGYGLDYNERYRNLPYVGVIRPEAVK
ncbi:MAG: hypoxanthine phosphoribosyltransferase [Peptococcaceae bacterium]|nr:hypoxanthine phosphoribosyltransferase [Peptococcaceae bacterium]MBQ3509051.1 hypoxanthine phosphoribosyltransferase [Peptococcaceae bacterium]